MKSILITGISGFVGGHYTRFLLNTKKDVIIHGISRSKPVWDFIKDRKKNLNSIHFYKFDLLDSTPLNRFMKDIQPDYILHLAALSSVAESWRTPVDSFCNNTTAFLNIVEAARNENPDCKILSVGSSEVYGIVKNEDLPIPETYRLSPSNPYAAARLSQEYLAHIYAKGYNLNICCARSFNHIGPGQKDHFVVSSIAKQFADISVNGKNPVINIGEGSIIRDFLDVEDVIVAYNAIFEKGLSGETYNVCSGKGYSILDIVNSLSEITLIKITIEQQKDLIRPVDNPVIIGNNHKIIEQTGWKPTIPFKATLKKIFHYWCKHV